MTGTNFRERTLPTTMPSEVHALLGPTNTGKTHYALTRMMSHGSGIMGFPLRLLARENYERLVKTKGKHNVALLTGEEKIVPPNARWFSCTVEAMPLDRKVDFIGIDEIQLAADPDRGHVFTERLLHARGRNETLFLGAETMRGILRKLVPGVTIETRPRLSHLVNTGPASLTRLPPRSAIVAFSATEVYALAEAIRQRRGGCAVIMGRLSPRTRNAQIELYQNREVDYLVATDAIGMGLNMDVDHVALAGLHKFDGVMTRPLTVQEIAQITGRAGRGMRDGTFGTTGTSTPMSISLIEAIEEHRFDPVRQLCWRQTALDYSGPEALLNSLLRKPPRPELVMGRVSSDLEVLNALIRSDEIRAAARGKKATMLLWDVCQIPDFRKIGDGSHARLCGRLFQELLKNGQVSPQWLDGHLRGLDRIEGDIDTLMHRLSGVRVCAYIAARQGWMRNGRHWQQRTREVEERLSDALHERLTARFVNKRATALLRHATPGEEPDLLHAVTRDGRIVVEGHDVGRLTGFTLETDVSADDAEAALLLRAGRKALRQAMPEQIRQFLTDKPEALSIEENGAIVWRGTPIAKLEKGENFFCPIVKLLPGEFQDTTQARLVEERANEIVSKRLRQQFDGFFSAQRQAEDQPALRGLVHRLVEDGGVTPVLDADHRFTGDERRQLHRLGIEVGPRHAYSARLLKPAQMRLMVLLASLQITPLQNDLTLTPPPPGRVSLPAAQGKGLPGWIEAGPVALRIDIAETLLKHLLPGRKNLGQRLPPANLPSQLGIKEAYLSDVLTALHLPHFPAVPLKTAQFGPPTPLLLKATRLAKRGKSAAASSRSPTRAHAHTRKADSESPFAALAEWKAPPAAPATGKTHRETQKKLQGKTQSKPQSQHERRTKT